MRPDIPAFFHSHLLPVFNPPSPRLVSRRRGGCAEDEESRRPQDGQVPMRAAGGPSSPFKRPHPAPPELRSPGPGGGPFSRARRRHRRRPDGEAHAQQDAAPELTHVLRFVSTEALVALATADATTADAEATPLHARRHRPPPTLRRSRTSSTSPSPPASTTSGSSTKSARSSKYSSQLVKSRNLLPSLLGFHVMLVLRECMLLESESQCLKLQFQLINF